MYRLERLRQDGAENPLLFYAPRDPFGEFSNFSLHDLWLPHPFAPRGSLAHYMTGEHRYQAMKADNREDHDYVLEVDNPGAAKNRGRQVSLREGWGSSMYGLAWYVMLEVIQTKVSAHRDVRDLLLSTGNRHIYEDSPIDDIWGWRYEQNYSGKNLLGECWMRVRDQLNQFLNA